MGRRKYVPENPTHMHRIGHRQPLKIVRQKRVAKGKGEFFSLRLLNFSPLQTVKHPKKTSFMDQKIVKSNGMPTVVSEKLVEVPEEFRMNTIDVSVETREYILSQSKNFFGDEHPWYRIINSVGKLSLNELALKAIEMTVSKEAADWWRQYHFKNWPINKSTVCRWQSSAKKYGKIYTVGAHAIGRKLEGPKLHERGIFKGIQLEFEAQVRLVFKLTSVTVMLVTTL